MGTITKLTFDEYLKLPEQEGAHYELDEGMLLMEPSPTFRHNRIRDQIGRRLTEFVKAHRLGEVTVETDFRLAPETVRSPDVALVTPAQMKKMDIDRSPIDGAPALAIEVISPNNLAQDTRKKVRQYLAAGCQAVWLVYPALRLVEIHDAAGTREIVEPDSIHEATPFSGKKFSLPLSAIFDSEF
ncbi:MAG TPA: Uma2 family endonuclease [Candidatus Angelobacter sp.]|nr:Uma2 family endonuclease [Candidatus Angelobacter sp.]